MTTFRHAVLALSLCGGLLTAAGVSAADAPAAAKSGVESPAAGQAQPPAAQGVQADKLPKQNANPLNLNPAQQQELAALRKEQVEHLQKVAGLERQLQDIAAADTFDKDKAEAIAKQVAEVTRVHLVAHAQHTNAFYVSLSAEQKKQFQAFEERRRKMQDRMMAGGHPARPMGKPANKPVPPQGSATAPGTTVNQP